jgi:hypothetical protein
MNIAPMFLDKERARELWRKYQEHKAYQQPHDEEIAQIYRRIAQGHTVIRALEAIRAAGFDSAKMPKLAIAPAHATKIFWRTNHVRGTFAMDAWGRGNESKRRRVVIDWADVRSDWPHGEAIVPLIPLYLRPRRGLQNYHILFEAEWTRVYPSDPYLLRRFGGDAWLVVAGWGLTDVERAVMTSRMRN